MYEEVSRVGQRGHLLGYFSQSFEIKLFSGFILGGDPSLTKLGNKASDISLKD